MTAHDDRTALHHIMSRDLVCARGELEISEITSLMIRYHLDCIPIVDDNRRPLGMITELDIVELVESSMSSVASGSTLPEIAIKRADQVMRPIALALDEHTHVSKAAALLTTTETQHVLAVSWDGALVGVVTAKDIVAWFLEIESPRTATSSSTWHALEG